MMPFLSRLYSPSDFGVYGGFMAIVSIFGASATFQYSQALMLPKEDTEAANLLAVSFLSTVGLSLLVYFVCLIFPEHLSSLIGNSLEPSFFYLIPIAVFVIGLNISLQAWCVRKKAFKRTSASQVVRTLSVTGGQIASGITGIGPIGLIGGSIFGDVMANLNLVRLFANNDLSTIRSSLKLREMFTLAKIHKAFAIYTNAQGVLNAIAQGIPVLLLARYYGVATAGFYAFSVRILQVPMNFVITSLRQVLFQKFCEVYNVGGDVERIFKKTTKRLALIAVAPAIVGMIWAPPIFSLIFGHEWRIAGQFVQLLIVGQVFTFCNVPANLLSQVLGQQRPFLLIHIFYFFANLFVLIVCGENYSAIITIGGLSLVNAVTSGMIILWIWHYLLRMRPKEVSFSQF